MAAAISEVDVCDAAEVGSRYVEATTESAGLHAHVSLKNEDVHIVIKDTSSTLWANGPYTYSINQYDKPVESGLTAPVIKDGKDGILITGTIRKTSISVEHKISPARTGLKENLKLTNFGAEDVQLEQLGFGFLRPLQTSTSMRLIACPFRRQVDNKVHDYSPDDLIAGRFSNSNGHNDAAVTDNEFCDSGLLRSEAWVVTEGNSSLLVAKYNPKHIEYSMAAVQDVALGKALRFGGAALSLFREPRGVTKLGPGESFEFGQTRLQVVDGGWQPAYEAYRHFLNEKGHGYPADYTRH